MPVARPFKGQDGNRSMTVRRPRATAVVGAAAVAGVGSLAAAGAAVGATSLGAAAAALGAGFFAAEEEPLRLLLAAGAAVNQVTNEGASPLYVAAQNGHAEPVRLLLRAEADPLLRFDGWSPMEKAREKGHAEIADLLQAAERGDKGALQDKAEDVLAEQLESTALAAAAAPASEAGSSAAHAEGA